MPFHDSQKLDDFDSISGNARAGGTARFGLLVFGFDAGDSVGGQIRVLTGDLPYEVEKASWSHDGKSTYFLANMGGARRAAAAT
jgi:hypothetical protein